MTSGSLLNDHMLNAINKLDRKGKPCLKYKKTPCALNKTVYDEDKESFNCQKSVSKVYHCIQDDGKRLGEICIQYVWVQPSMY